MKMKYINNDYKIHDLSQNKNRDRLEIKLECSRFFFPAAQPSGDLAFDSAWFYTPGGSPKTN